jgi:hypothetical protein
MMRREDNWYDRAGLMQTHGLWTPLQRHAPW